MYMVGIKGQSNDIKDYIGDKEKGMDMHEALTGEKLRPFHFINAIFQTYD